MEFIKGLKADFETGEGSIELEDDFCLQDNLTKADILKDWIHILTAEYNTILEEGILS